MMKTVKHRNTTHYCLISLGANLPSATGTALETLEKSLGLFPSESFQIDRISKWFSTPAFPKGSGPDFVNGAIRIQTTLEPGGVMSALHRIEAQLGRTRENRWEPRLCDLDLIAYDNQILPDLATFQRWNALDPAKQKTETPDQLILPHPRLQDRSFVLVPLHDIAPDWRHPITGITVSEMLGAISPEKLAEITEISA
ncbi:MAG: 2-amino-4-hydroxy-6-hydroxymethyldihydropteridine diphosphokinase [Paracoccaceae bacterium]